MDRRGRARAPRAACPALSACLSALRNLRDRVVQQTKTPSGGSCFRPREKDTPKQVCVMAVRAERQVRRVYGGQGSLSIGGHG